MTAPKTPPDPRRIVQADFVAGAALGGQLPPPTLAEVAFAGRSNVGKSSLINALVERKNLVRTSSTPGSTRQINFYEARAADGAIFRLVDLPGYGFTRRSKSEMKQWAALIEEYLSMRVTLGAVVVLSDVRRGLEAADEELLGFVEAGTQASRRAPKLLFVATKIDKLAKSERRVALAGLNRPKEGGEDARAKARRWMGFSAVTGEGRPEVWAAIRRAVLGVLDAQTLRED